MSSSKEESITASSTAAVVEAMAEVEEKEGVMASSV
jgi:hypothetical protein